MPNCRVLIVDDHEPLRRFVRSMLQQKHDLKVIGEASDGSEAVQKAEELRPDLILLDIGLPKLNGMEAARRLRQLVPGAKILFLSQESSRDLVREALSLGAAGYVNKLDAQSELLPAIEAVLGAEQFVSSGLEGWESTESTNAQLHSRHSVQFYHDDSQLLDDISTLLHAALDRGDSTIVLASQYHRERFRAILGQVGLDTGSLRVRRRYFEFDAADTLSRFMVDGLPDATSFAEIVGRALVEAEVGAESEHPGVFLFGEMVALLWAEGNAEATIRLERLWNELAHMHSFDLRCAYPASAFHARDEDHLLKICAEHSHVISPDVRG